VKTVLKVAGIVVAVLIVAAIAIPFLVNVNSFRPQIESNLSSALGRPVKVGNLSLSIFSGSVGADLSCAIWRSSATADHRSSRGAVRRRHHARSHATSTKMPVIKLARRWGRRSCKKVEMRFAHLKTHRRFERMRLRGLSGARDTPLCKTLRPSRAASGDRR